MTNQPENPPAFPRAESGPFDAVQDGMTLRDWVAGQALASVMSSVVNLDSVTVEDRTVIFKALARYMYEVADAMLAERSARP